MQKQAQPWCTLRAVTLSSLEQACGNIKNRMSLTDSRRRPARPNPRTALILYGSETGNAQDVAEEVGRMAERLRFDTIVVNMDAVQLRDLLKPAVVIFAISTTGQGEMPQNARSFWKTLLSSALKPGLLRRLRFSSFGLGDSSYLRYNTAHRMLCSRLQQLGAQAFCDRGEGNEQHPEGHSAGLREWIVQLKQRVMESFPLPEGLDPIADVEFLQPKWKLQIAGADGTRSGIVANRYTNGVAQNVTSGVQTVTLEEQQKPRSVDSGDDVPSFEQLPVKGAYSAAVKANDRITAADHFQDVRLLDLRIEDEVSYGPGAVAVVYPKNFPRDVQDFINLMGWQDVVDRPLELVSTRSGTSDSSPSPLRHLYLWQTEVTVRWLLENVLDIMSVPRRSFFASLAYFAGDSTEDEAYQKERLHELASPELIDELWDYTTRPKRTILEVMMDFTTIKIPWQYALSLIPTMRGRQFSIASGGDMRRYEDGATRVQLLVAIADPPSPIIKYRRRYGVCTRYIATLKVGQKISIGIQQGYLDVNPTELEVPVVMVGPGTGLAPMRSMVNQRQAWARDLGVRTPGKRLQDDVLFFGCRSRDGDYFFRDEWQSLSTSEGLREITAFSRDKIEPKQYVQDQIRAYAATVYRALFESKGKVYVCGSSGNMPKGVREALVDVLVEESGKTLSRKQAEGYLDGMEKEGRYKQETW